MTLIKLYFTTFVSLSTLKSYLNKWHGDVKYHFFLEAEKTARSITILYKLKLELIEIELKLAFNVL